MLIRRKLVLVRKHSSIKTYSGSTIKAKEEQKSQSALLKLNKIIRVMSEETKKQANDITN